jgi:hypothetical protein
MKPVSPLVKGSGPISVEVDQKAQAELAKQFAAYAKQTSQLLVDLVKEEAALTCREAINLSPPLDGANGGQGDKKIAETWGDAAVERDVRAVVVPDSKMLSAAVHPATGNGAKFAKWKAGKRPKAGILQKIYDDQDYGKAYNKARQLFSNRAVNVIPGSAIQAEHDRERRLYRGRIRRNGGPSTKQSPDRMKISTEGAIKDYIKKRKLRVGFMKSGWLAVIAKLGKPVINGVPKNFGVKAMPAWIKRHAASHGQVTIIGDNTAYSGLITAGDKRLNIIIKNDYGNMFGAADRAATAMKVLLNRSGKLAARAGHFQKIAAEKFNAGQPQG